MDEATIQPCSISPSLFALLAHADKPPNALLDRARIVELPSKLTRQPIPEARAQVTVVDLLHKVPAVKTMTFGEAIYSLVNIR